MAVEIGEMWKGGAAEAMGAENGVRMGRHESSFLGAIKVKRR
jgi:hypothetical protein